MRVLEKFVGKVVTAEPGTPLSSVARLMAQHNVGAVVIAEGRRPVGIVTDRDVALELGARGIPAATPAVRVMSTPPVTVSVDDSVFSVTQAMQEAGVRRLPVVDSEGILVGIATFDDLVKILASELSNLAAGIDTAVTG